MEAYRISPADRSTFKTCRRAWDFSAYGRRNLRPRIEPTPPDLATSFRQALEVYYFPGMWAWSRAIVLPLVHAAFDRAAAPTEGPPATAEAIASGHRLIDAYAEWAPSRDRFTPMQVATEVEINVPDPVLSDRDLTTMEGAAVKFCTWLDGLVFGEDERPWLLCHRIAAEPWEAPEVLGVEEEALTDCWAWAHFALDPRVAGFIYNEVRLPSAASPAPLASPASPAAFRRTAVPITAGELAAAGRQLGYEALEMLDAGLVVYPHPSPSNCRACPWLAPCRATRTGGPATAALVLAEGYEPSPPPPLIEGRLGARTWSMGRGARPNRFDT